MAASTTLTPFTWPTPTPTQTKLVTSTTLVTTTRPARSISETIKPNEGRHSNTQLLPGLLGGALGIAIIVIIALIIYILRRKGKLPSLKPESLDCGVSESTNGRPQLPTRDLTHSEQQVVERSYRPMATPEMRNAHAWAPGANISISPRVAGGGNWHNHSFDKSTRLFSNEGMVAGTPGYQAHSPTPETRTTQSYPELGISIPSPQNPIQDTRTGSMNTLTDYQTRSGYRPPSTGGDFVIETGISDTPTEFHRGESFSSHNSYTVPRKPLPPNSATMHPVPWPLRPGSQHRSPPAHAALNPVYRKPVNRLELRFGAARTEQTTPVTVPARVHIPEHSGPRASPPSLRRVGPCDALRKDYQV